VGVGGIDQQSAMKCFLGVSSLKKDGQGRDLSFADLTLEQYEEIHSWLADVEFFKQNRNLSWIVRADCEAISALLDEATKSVHLRPFPFDTGSAGSERLHLEANRGFLSYLSSARIYLAYTELNLKKQYGHDSVHVARFKAASSKEYDECFGYRLFDKLRNYAQHCGFPVGAGFHMAGNGDGRTMDVTLHVHFDRKRLLLERDVWKSALKAELEAGTGPIQALPLLLEHTDCIMRIARSVELSCAVELHNALAGLRQVMHDYRDETALFAIHKEIGKVEIPGGHDTTYTDEQFPVNVFPIIERDIPKPASCDADIPPPLMNL